MRLLLALAFGLTVLFGCRSRQTGYLPWMADTVAATASAYTLQPTPDTGTLSRVLIPDDLAGCQAEMDRMLPPALRQELGDSTGRGLAQHRGWLARWMKDKWGLWSVSRLREYFIRQGLSNPDDMAAVILDSYWIRRQGKAPSLPCLVSHYQERRRRIDSLSRYAGDIMALPPFPVAGACGG